MFLNLWLKKKLKKFQNPNMFIKIRSHKWFLIFTFTKKILNRDHQQPLKEPIKEIVVQGYFA